MSYDPIDAIFLEKAKGGFADVALLTNTAGVSSEVPVIFDRENALMNIAGMGVQSAKPQAVIASKYIPDPDLESAATIIIQGIAFNIARLEPDADGTTVLILSKD